MGDEELAAAADAPVEAVPALRGARTLVEAREYARLVLEPELPELLDGGASDARPVRRAPDDWRRTGSHADAARAILRELKAVGGDLRSLRLALTGAPTGPELAAVLAALPREEALARAERARRPPELRSTDAPVRHA